MSACVHPCPLGFTEPIEQLRSFDQRRVISKQRYLCQAVHKGKTSRAVMKYCVPL